MRSIEEEVWAANVQPYIALPSCVATEIIEEARFYVQRLGFNDERAAAGDPNDLSTPRATMQFIADALNSINDDLVWLSPERSDNSVFDIDPSADRLIRTSRLPEAKSLPVSELAQAIGSCFARHLNDCPKRQV